MTKVYTMEDYAKSYTELMEILKYVSKDDLVKIPKNILLKYIKNQDTNYSFSYNPQIDVQEQNVSKLTLILLANLYIEYFADANEQEYIKNKDIEELKEIEKQNQEKYDVYSKFDKRKQKTITSTSEITSLAIVPDKTNIIKKIFYKIKSFFKS